MAFAAVLRLRKNGGTAAESANKCGAAANVPVAQKCQKSNSSSNTHTFELYYTFTETPRRWQRIEHREHEQQYRKRILCMVEKKKDMQNWCHLNRKRRSQRGQQTSRFYNIHSRAKYTYYSNIFNGKNKKKHRKTN